MSHSLVSLIHAQSLDERVMARRKELSELDGKFTNTKTEYERLSKEVDGLRTDDEHYTSRKGEIGQLKLQLKLCGRK